ncbi:MAG TPA: hypothetical protein VGF97_02730 [Rhizomicrobium sp.]|jgi:hypothetical protein
MDAFSYLSVLLSIVLGLGLANLLTGFAAMVRARNRVDMFWPLPVQMLLFFLLHVQLWWALFTLRNFAPWRIQSFLIVLMQPVVLYLGTALLVPDIPAEGRIDLRQVYFRESRWFFGAIVVALLVSIAKSYILGGGPPNRTDLAGHAAFFVVALAGMILRSDLAHKIIAPLSLAIFSAYIALLFIALPR